MTGTIKEIAQVAKVSIATVSLVLNHKPGVSDTTRQKVLEITKSINPELFQKKMKTIRTGSVRFLKIVKHGHVLNRDHNTFISSYIDGLQLEARNNGFNLEVNTYNASDIRDILKQTEDSTLDGVVILGTELDEDDLKVFKVIEKPVVVIDTSFDFLHFDFVDMNNAEAVFHIVNYFLQNGHREIGHITSPVSIRNFELRYLAFHDALRYYNLPYQKRYIYSVDSTFDGAYNDMLDILNKKNKVPPALFVTNDIISYGCIKALKEKGFKVPEDISIIGFDNLPLCAVMEPPLTTMNVSKRQIGKMAMRMIINRINNDFSAPAFKISISGELIHRNSVKNLTQPINIDTFK
jgi:LacI family transcriptional regulator